jgi:hypothetical protein
MSHAPAIRPRRHVEPNRSSSRRPARRRDPRNSDYSSGRQVSTARENIASRTPVNRSSPIKNLPPGGKGGPTQGRGRAGGVDPHHNHQIGDDPRWRQHWLHFGSGQTRGPAPRPCRTVGASGEAVAAAPSGGSTIRPLG